MVPQTLITTDAMCAIKLEPGLEQILEIDNTKTELADGDISEDMVVDEEVVGAEEMVVAEEIEKEEEEVGVSHYSLTSPKV